MKLVQLDKENFDELVTNADKPVVVEFFSPGCSPCNALAMVLEEMATAHPEVSFAAMDTVRFPDVAWAFDVMAAPTGEWLARLRATFLASAWKSFCSNNVRAGSFKPYSLFSATSNTISIMSWRSRTPSFV